MRHCKNCGEPGHYAPTCSKQKETRLEFQIPKIPRVIHKIENWEFVGFTYCSGCEQEKVSYQPVDSLGENYFYTGFPILCRECIALEKWSLDRAVQTSSIMDSVVEKAIDQPIIQL